MWGDNVAEALPWLFGGLTRWGVEVVLYLIAGVICAVTLPWVLYGLAWVHHAVAKGMLGPWRTDALAQEVRAEAAARGAAVHAEDVSLRRLERDIHDGPQQRLVRLQMDLAALERRAEAGDTRPPRGSRRKPAARPRPPSTSCARCPAASLRPCCRTAAWPPPCRRSPPRAR